MPPLTKEQKDKIRDSIFVVNPCDDLWAGQGLHSLLELTLHQGLSLLLTGDQVKTYKGRVVGLSYVVTFSTQKEIKGQWESEDFNEALICAACMALGTLPTELQPKKRVVHQIEEEEREPERLYGLTNYDENELESN